jgi:glycosyltransferase involved in cell wall biosynthesis
MRERSEKVDVLLVKLGSTSGLAMADDELSRSMQRAGAKVLVANTERPDSLPTMALTDLMWACAARRAAKRMLERLHYAPPRAVIYSTTTAALFWPRPGAIRFDAPAAANRPGRHGLWQRPLERHRLRHAPLLLPWSEGGLAEAGAAVPDCAERALVLPASIELSTVAGSGRSGALVDQEGNGRRLGPPERDVAAITYAGNPHKKGFDRVLEAWRRARRPSEQMLVVGITDQELRQRGFEVNDEDVHILGSIPQGDLRQLLRRTKVFVCAPRREDYGLIQLEALAEGCRLVTTPAPGPYVALSLAHQLDPRLVSEDLGGALRRALDAPVPGYAEQAAELVEPFGSAAVDRLVAERLLPRLLRE